MTARVLVVDDVPANVKLLEARLAAEYFEVLTAYSGPEALDVCARERVDVVLLDVMMPGMDGFEVCRRIKREPATAHVPVIMVTALDQSTDKVQGLDARLSGVEPCRVLEDVLANPRLRPVSPPNAAHRRNQKTLAPNGLGRTHGRTGAGFRPACRRHQNYRP